MTFLDDIYRKITVWGQGTVKRQGMHQKRLKLEIELQQKELGWHILKGVMICPQCGEK